MNILASSIIAAAITIYSTSSVCLINLDDKTVVDAYKVKAVTIVNDKVEVIVRGKEPILVIPKTGKTAEETASEIQKRISFCK